MKTMRFPPSPGDRFVQRSDAGISTALTLERIAIPEGLNDDRYFVFRAGAGGPPFRYSVSGLAGMLVRGTLVRADPSACGLVRDKRANPLVDWGRLKPNQLERVTRRLAYVHGLSVHAEGLSFKSRDYRAMVEKIAQKRGEPAPHPTSVYRWSLRWRRSGNSVAALALEVATNRHRTKRKPMESRLARAFLQAKLSRVEKTPLSELHAQFQEVVHETTLETLDAQVAALMEEAAANVQAQRTHARARAKARRKKRSK